ncbi:MAG: SGNH/GDSL hydrolase family protein, partial [Lachnospiraceae bacterium]
TGDEPFVLKIKSPYLLLVSKDSGDNAFGKADIYVDGEFAFTADPHVNGWNHCNAQVVYRGKENTEHTVEIRRHADAKDKKFIILGFGYQGE